MATWWCRPPTRRSSSPRRPTGGSTYLQQGNITVQAGGKLIVENVSLEFVEFVSSTGTLGARVSHIYNFTDQGTTELENSTILTDSSILNAYAKLTLNVSDGGVFTATNSSFMFPGWIQVYGAGSTLDLNQSTVRGNPAIETLVENESLQADTLYAASLSASAGAQVSLWNSSVLGVYTDNVTAKGMPGPIALANTGAYELSSGSSQDLTTFDQPTDSENVTRADLYPSFAGGTVILGYNANLTTASTGNTFTFGATYPLPTINFPQGIGFTSVPLPPAAVAAINAVGPLGWLEATGAFQDPSSIALHIGVTGSAQPITVAYTAIQLTPVLDYNITATGAGTTFTAVDSTLDLNWNETPGTPVPFGTAAPQPWGSNKLLLSDGATAYLASDSIVQGRVGVFFNQSAVIPDATSNAYFYRWAAVPVFANGGVPVIDAQLTAYYSYSSSEANNATATSLNDLATADPSLFHYVTSWDAMHQVGQYGQTQGNGYGFLLLATTALNQATLPDGTYLGGYHLAVALPNGGPAGVKWGYAAVTPYPSGMTPASPDIQGAIVYGNYASHVSIGSIAVLVGDIVDKNTAVTIGSDLTVTATLTNTGNAPIQNYTANFSYWLPAPFQPKVVAPVQAYTTLLAGGNNTVTFNWTVNESVVGAHGTFNATFVLASAWNGGSGPNAGTVSADINVTIAPSLISLTFLPPSGVLTVNQEYVGDGNVTFNGTGSATINITAIASNGNGKSFFLTTASDPSGPFLGTIIVGPAEPSGEYELIVTAFYNGRTATDTFHNAFSVAGPPRPDELPQPEVPRDTGPLLDPHRDRHRRGRRRRPDAPPAHRARQGGRVRRVRRPHPRGCHHLPAVRRRVRGGPRSVQSVRFHDPGRLEGLPRVRRPAPGRARGRGPRSRAPGLRRRRRAVPRRVEEGAGGQLQRGRLLGLVEAPADVPVVQPVPAPAGPGQPGRHGGAPDRRRGSPDGPPGGPRREEDGSDRHPGPRAC